MAIIYKITNLVNNKCYIGKASNNIIPIHRHFSNAINGKPYILSRAIRKYGFNSFYSIIIEYCSDRDSNYLEKYYIKVYDSFNSGYNMTLGGDGGNTLTSKSASEIREIRVKQSESISLSQTGISRTEKAKKALSKAQSALWKRPYYKNSQIKAITKSIEVRKLENPCIFKEIAQKGIETKITKNIFGKQYVITTPGGDFITVKNLKQFCRANNLHPGNMVQVAKGNRKYCKGYRCRYK